MKFLFKLLIIISLATCSQSYAQVDIGKNESQAVILTLDDGSVIYGIITERTDFEVTVQSASLGSVVIPIASVTNTKYIDDVRNYIYDNDGNPVDFHNSTHYFLFPSGYGLKKGQSYYENIGVFFNTVSYGVSDNFSISAGAEVISLLFGIGTPGMYISPKLTIPFGNQKGAFGINATAIVLPSNNFDGFSFLSGSATFGSRNNNITIGTGAGFNFEGGITDEVIPFTVGIMKRLGPKLSFISENWVFAYDDFTEAEGIISAGLRVHFKNVGGAFNFGLFRPIADIGPFIGLPFISATVPLGL